MLDYNKINNLRKLKNIPKMEFYEKIGMSSAGYIEMVRNNSIKVDTLLKISELLGVRMDDLRIQEFPGATINLEKVKKDMDAEELKVKYMELMEKHIALQEAYEKLLHSNSRNKKAG